MILAIWSVGGLIVGGYQWLSGRWPKMTLHVDEVSGLCTTQSVDYRATFYFLLLMGPLFWTIVVFYLFFSLACRLLGKGPGPCRDDSTKK